jgi:UDP-N-acetylmuramate dehydrogenase
MNSDTKKLIGLAEENFHIHRIPYKKDLSLRVLSSFKIGGISPLVVEPENFEQIESMFNILMKDEIPFKILGGGSNILISEHPDDFVVIRLSGQFKEYFMKEDGYFQIGAATNTTPTFRQISQKGYKGVEFLSTIPGWTGGAVIQNAGCYGGEIFDFIQSVTFYSLQDKQLHTVTRDKIEYGYRSTSFLKNKNSLILSIDMKLEEGDLDEIEQSLKEKRDKRNSSQPENKKSAGSVFKNPLLKDEHGNPVKSWKLIDQAGLRGTVHGGAQISPEHCNFIVNLGDAKASDVDYLIQLIQEKVHQSSGIALQKEIEYFGTIP